MTGGLNRYSLVCNNQNLTVCQILYKCWRKIKCMYIELRENSTKYGKYHFRKHCKYQEKKYVLHVPKRLEHLTNK